MLASYGHSCQYYIKLWKPAPAHIRELNVLLRRLAALEKDLQREDNRRESSVFGLVSERVNKSLEDMINALKFEIDKLTKDIDAHIDQCPDLKKTRELLESIKDVGLSALGKSAAGTFTRAIFVAVTSLTKLGISRD
jgi:transposase